MNLQVENCQRCKHAFTCPVVYACSCVWRTFSCMHPLRVAVHLCTLLCSTVAKSLQPYPTLCDPIDSSPPGSSVPGVLQARTLGWVAISLSSVQQEEFANEGLMELEPRERMKRDKRGMKMKNQRDSLCKEMARAFSLFKEALLVLYMYIYIYMQQYMQYIYICFFFLMFCICHLPSLYLPE